MKRFDKGYIYSALLSDFFSSLVAIFFLFENFLFDETTKAEDIIGAIPFIVIGFIAIYLFFTVYRILYYRTSGYELTETEIKCKRGVLFKKRSVLDYKKIHAINKKQNLFHRIFDIAILTVDSGATGNSQQAEITIIEKEKTVDALVNELNALKENGTRDVEDVSVEADVLLSDKDSLYNFTSKKKMLYTLINIVSTVFITALLGALVVIVIAVCKLMIQFDFLGAFIIAALITVAAMLLFSIFSFIGCMIHSFVGYHKFTVTKQGNNIQISFGLLEKHTNTFSYDRIKAVKISQSLVQRMLGFAAIKLEVIGYTSDNANENNAEIGMLVPFCKYSEVGEILAKVLPDYIPDEKQTKAESYFPFVSWFLLVFGIVAGVSMLSAVAILQVFNVPASVISAVLLSVIGAGILVLIVKLVSAALSYKTNGIAINNGKVTAYSGGFTRNITVFMAKNLIAVENVTTPLRKKSGIASLVMHLKTNALSNEVKVHIQKDTLSEELEKLLIL